VVRTVVRSRTVAEGLLSSGGAGAGSSGSINVLMVNNPKQLDLEKLTDDNLTEQTSIKVNYTVLLAGFAAQDKLVQGLPLGAVK